MFKINITLQPITNYQSIQQARSDILLTPLKPLQPTITIPLYNGRLRVIRSQPCITTYSFMFRRYRLPFSSHLITSYNKNIPQNLSSPASCTHTGIALVAHAMHFYRDLADKLTLEVCTFYNHQSSPTLHQLLPPTETRTPDTIHKHLGRTSICQGVNIHLTHQYLQGQCKKH